MTPVKFPYAKAIYAGLVAFLGALATALADEDITGQEWIAVASTTLVAIGAVYGVTGTEPTAGRGGGQHKPIG